MQFELNGEVEQVQGPLNLSTLLERFELQKHRVAVAVNEVLVPRSRFERHEIHEGDRIEVIQAVGGG